MTRGNQDRRRIEILAPAGSYESFLAAVRAGADAVYAGGPRFGARAFADNFTEDMLLKAIDYAHLHGRKLYLTVNTLLKDAETDHLYEYLAPLYRQGLDAVIVQDAGVLEFMRTQFPKMAVHASTQMTITNAEGALFLEEQGVERVVPARELSLEEVREIADRTGLEIECFVHGALCYCYSGQCLLSSLIGGRSGNRGQCAQPCRLPFTTDKKKEHLLSLKDICTLELIPELVEAGIDSFKIEGRMKKPEYVALVTSMYRKYTDLYLEEGKEAFRVTEQDKEMLMDIYNRGGFSTGYYRQHNGRDMLSLKRPNHAGVPAVRVTGQKGREVFGEALTDIHKGDILELDSSRDHTDTKNNYTFGKDAGRGSGVSLLVPKGRKYAKGIVLYRLRNQSLLDDIGERYGRGAVWEPITGRMELRQGEKAVLTVSRGEVSVTVRAEELTEEAKNQPLDETRLRKQLQKTGNTEFNFENLEIVTEGAVFLPMQRINELRRRALELLEKKICDGFRRKEEGTLYGERMTDQVISGSLYQEEWFPRLSALVESKEQLRAAADSDDLYRIYIDSVIEGDIFRDHELAGLRDKCKETGKEFFLAMPHIFRKEAAAFFDAGWEDFLKFGFDGVLVRNYESFHYLKEHGFDKKVILDHNLYVFNQKAKQFWNRQGQISFTAPAELNEGELKELGISVAELVAYGRLPAMVTAQCILKTTDGCSRVPGITRISDRYQKEFPVRNCCRFCYNIIYYTSPLFTADLKESLRGLSPAGLRMQFSLEDAEETARIIRLCGDIYHRDMPADLKDTDFTRGHFKRGVT